MTKVTQLSVGEGRQLRNRPAHFREVPSEPGDVPLGTIGQELRGARISRGEDLASVSRALKIRKDHLEALENDDLSHLPGRTYAVGFLRAYAEYLNLKPEETVQRFKTEIAGRDEATRNAGFPEPEEEAGLSLGWWLFAVVVLGLIAYGAYYLVTSSGSSTPSAIAPVPAQFTQNAKSPAVSRPRNPVPRSVTAPGNFSANGTGAIGGQVYGAENAGARIVLRAMQPTRVLVQSEDGAALINQTLEPGDSYRVPNTPGLSLTVEHGNAVELLLDGKSAGTAGSTADITAAMPLDPLSVAERQRAPQGSGTER